MYQETTRSGVWAGKATGAERQRVAAVLAFRAADASKAVFHLRQGAPGTPVWLYSTVPPSAETAVLCERVFVCSSPWRLVLQAQKHLWPLRAALAVGAWTGGRGNWLLKLSPFLIPPFRALMLNSSGDFLPGTPRPMAAHFCHVTQEAEHNAEVRAREISVDVWQLLRYHIWRSGTVTRVKDRAGALQLFVLASVLRICAYPHRRIFSRLHGDGALEAPDATGGPAQGIVHYHQEGPDWNAAAIEELVRGGGARYLAWHNGSGPGEIDDLLPLFEDGRTFAVARQSSYRAWKPLLIPTAPFRTLQPAEKTRVLAPVGSRLVVDLHKLAALGVPDVAHPIAAWMLLFWKASAAGWHCYCAGQNEALARQPDFPSEETAFFLRVVLDKQWRKLGPRQPLLARGNIAFSSRTMAPARVSGPDRLRILLVSPFLPFPLSHGGAVRIYNLCRALSEHVDFVLVAVREHQEAVDYEKLHDVFCEVYIVDIDETAPAPDALPEQVRQLECPSLRALIAEICREWRPDLVQFEFTHTAGLRDSAAGVPAILVEHDITYGLYRQLAEAEPGRKSRREYGRWLAFEKRWLREYDAVWTVCEADRREAIDAGWRHPGRTFNVPNGVDIRRYAPAEQACAPLGILFVGSFRHLPNVRAFEALTSDIMPLVWVRFPQAVLHVVAGPRHEWFWIRNRRRNPPGRLDPRIQMHGFVEDLRPLYAEATVVVAPLVVSAGTNIKILEAMACGKPIVSTQPGCSGLGLADNADLLIRDGAEPFAAAVCDLFAQPELRRQIGSRARQTVEERFSWTALAARAMESYRTVAGREDLAGASPR
jgi:glycosyltransferase involved in cell wall biosynthesis